MELMQGHDAFSKLLGLPVRDQAGRSLGRVREARAHWDANGCIVLDELMVGRRALWQRLRGPAPDAHGIPWEQVLEVGDDAIVVHLAGS